MIETIHLQVLLATFAGWIGRQQTAVISYLIEENRVLKEQLESGGKRLQFTDDQAPNMNVYAERFVRSIKYECLDQMIILGRESLVRSIEEYAAHYHDERSHQGIGNMMISGAVSHGEGVIETRERLGGLLKYYHRRAA